MAVIMADQVLVFVSHTQAMKRYPRGASFVDSAEDAINAIESAKAHHMAYFPAADVPPAEYSLRQLRKASVFVAVVGLDSGSRVPGDQARSFTELEFDTATELTLPRLVFLLDPASAQQVGMSDAVMSPDQVRFRQKLEKSGATVAFFTNADDLKYKVHAAVTQLIEERGTVTPTGPPSGRSSAPTRAKTPAYAGLAVLLVLATIVLAVWSTVVGAFPPWSSRAVAPTVERECSGVTVEVVGVTGASFGPERGTTLRVRITNAAGNGAVTVPASRQAVVRGDSGRRQYTVDQKFADTSWFFDVEVQPGASVVVELGVAALEPGDRITVVIPDIRGGGRSLDRCHATTPPAQA